MIVKLLTERHLEFLSLKGGCTGSSESTLVKMSNCWKSHALAQLYFYLRFEKANLIKLPYNLKMHIREFQEPIKENQAAIIAAINLTHLCQIQRSILIV